MADAAVDISGMPVPQADISGMPVPPDTAPALEVPAALAPAPVSATVDPSLGTLDALQHYIRSAVAPLGGGLAYLGAKGANALGAGGDEQTAQDVKQQTESAIAGEPMTKSGAAIVNTINNATTPYLKQAQEKLQEFADKTYETGIPVPGGGFVGAHTALAGAFGATLPQALLSFATGGRAAEAAGGVFEGAEIPKPSTTSPLGAPPAAAAPPTAQLTGPVTGADLLSEPDPLGLHEHAAATTVTPPGTQGGPTAGLGSTPAGTGQRGGPKWTPSTSGSPYDSSPTQVDPWKGERVQNDRTRAPEKAPADNGDPYNSTPGQRIGGGSQRGGPKFTPTQGTGKDTAGQVVEYAAPKDEGLQSGARAAADQAQRAATLGALDQLSGGQLSEVRTSAVTGDTKETGTDWAHAKVSDAGGNRMTGVIANEQNAVRSASANIQKATGDPQDGVDRDAQLGRGTALNGLFSAVQDHFDKGSAALYQDANGKASTAPLANIDRVKAVLSDPANFPGVEGKALHEDLISRGQQLGFLPKGATAQPQDALSARMQSAGLTPPSNTSMPTVQHGEQWRQFTGDLWSSKTARTIQKFRDAMDEDAGSASHQNLYTAARAMNTQRRTLFEPEAMQKLIQPKDRAGVEGMDVADIPDHIAEQGEGQFNHVVNVIKSAAHLKSIDHDFPTLAADAMNALRGHMAAKLHDAGVSKVQGGWDPKSYYNKANAYSLKLPMIFKPQELENIRTVNRAGNVLKMDKTYKGAEVEAQNIGIVGRGRTALGAAARGAVDVGSHSLLGPLGPAVTEVSGLSHAVQKVVGGNPEKALEAKRLKEVNSRIQKVGAPTAAPTPETPKGAPRPKQRGGPAITGHDGPLRQKLERMAGLVRKGAQQNNASGESAASQEAINRHSQERAAGQNRYHIDPDGNVTPITGATGVDARAQPGHIIVQRGVGATPYSILDRGGLPAAQAHGLLTRASGNLMNAEREVHGTLGQRIGGAKQRGGPKFEPPKEQEPGATLNVGLHIGDPANGGRVMHPDEAISAIKAAGGNVGKTSVVQSGTEPTLVADLRDPFAKKDLGNLSSTLHQDAIAQRHADGTGILAGPKAKDWGGEYNPDFFREHSGQTATEAHPVMSNLTSEERGQLRTDTTKRMLDAFDALPHTAEYAAAAVAGQAKKGWYENSAKTIANVFGPDAPRFSALLASMSPQTSVQMNFHNALRTFVNWDKAGRPQDPKVIEDIARKSVLRQENGTGLLHAWVPNMIRSLTSDTPDKLTLSGPKVHSFYGNLNDKVNEVTNDAWMANFAKMDAAKLHGGINKAGTAPGKSPTYMAMSAKVRAAAAMLSKATGETWTPREVQETVWSWAKTAFEHANKTDRTIPDLVKSGDITDDLIKSTPDFHQLFSSPEHAGFLAGSRFAENAGRVSAEASPTSGGASASKTSPALKNIIKGHLEGASRRLESIRQGRKVTAEDEDVPF